MSKVIMYDDKDGHKQLAIKTTLRECLDWGGLSVCDFCNEFSNDGMYLCPELGSYASCEKCFKEHQERVELYVEDIPYMIENLKYYPKAYGLELSDEDREIIDTFISILKEVEDSNV